MATPTRQKKPAGQDWHPADVTAALHKSNWSMRQLSLANGFQQGTLKKALSLPYPKAEAIIAAALGLEPKAIWPSRYNDDGTPNRVAKRPVMNGPAGLHAHTSVKRSGDSHTRNLQAARG